MRTDLYYYYNHVHAIHYCTCRKVTFLSYNEINLHNIRYQTYHYYHHTTTTTNNSNIYYHEV